MLCHAHHTTLYAVAYVPRSPCATRRSTSKCLLQSACMIFIVGATQHKLCMIACNIAHMTRYDACVH